MTFEVLQKLATTKDVGTKAVLLVMDGVGDLPHPDYGGKTPLEAAHTPNLDQLAQEGVGGVLDPIAPGITPGSGPGHLGLLGYDPLAYQVGRGVFEALGSGFELTPQDLAIRGNFAAVKKGPSGEWLVTDRRAYRMGDRPDEQCRKLCAQMVDLQLPGVTVFARPVSEHRFLLVLRGAGLSPEIAETDPQALLVPPLPPVALVPTAEKTSALIAQFIDQVQQALDGETVVRPASLGEPDQAERYYPLLRGYGKYPTLTTLPEIYGVRAAAVATYPMYRGVAQVVGMAVFPEDPTGKKGLAAQVETLKECWQDFDFFFFHVKYTDQAGEDGKFEEKKRVIEEVDRIVVPAIRALNPTVIAVTGDHSTPVLLKSHSWHPVPVVLWSLHGGVDSVSAFHERACAGGALGRFRAVELMPQIMANARRVEKFGA